MYSKDKNRSLNMSDKLLDERDVLMKKVAVQQMKNKKL